MQAVKCPKCGATFDVSHLPPASEFVCGSCHHRLRTPGAPAGGPAPRSRRTGAPPPAARGPAPAARAPAPAVGRRAAGADRSAPGRAARGPDRRSARRGAPRDEAPEKSKLPLVLGGVGGLVVVVAIVAVFAFSGGGDDSHGGRTAMAPGTSPAGPSKAEQLEDLNRQYLAASGSRSLTALQTVFEKARSLGTAGQGLAKKAAESAVLIQKNTDWAQLALGLVKFDGSGLPDDNEAVYTTDDYDTITKYREKVWLTPEESKECAAAKKAFLEHFSRLKTDAHYKKVCMVESNIAKHPVFQNYKYKVVEARPYLLFIEDTGNKAKLAELEKKAELKAAIFTRLYQVFLETFQKPFGLKRLESDVFKDDAIMKAWIFASRESFNKYQNTIGQPVPDGVAAYYNPTDQWMIIPESEPDKTLEGFTTGCHFHEGTHQLIHYYTKWLVEKDIGEEISWTDPRLDSNSHWFQEGIAEFFGNVRRTKDSWDLFQYSRGRMAGWKAIRRMKGQEWSLPKLLKATGNQDLAINPPWMGSLFYSQAWAFTYFLWNYDDAKYRPKFMEYAKEEFHGRSGLKVFQKVFGIDKIAGSELEKEYFEYAKGLIERARVTPEMAAGLGIQPDPPGGGDDAPPPAKDGGR